MTVVIKTIKLKKNYYEEINNEKKVPYILMYHVTLWGLNFNLILRACTICEVRTCECKKLVKARPRPRPTGTPTISSWNSQHIVSDRMINALLFIDKQNKALILTFSVFWLNNFWLLFVYFLLRFIVILRSLFYGRSVSSIRLGISLFIYPFFFFNF